MKRGAPASFAIALVFAGAVASLVQGPCLAQAAKVTRVRGYVVERLSPTQFTVEDVRMGDDRVYRVALEGPAADARPETIRIGAELDLQGTLAESGELRVTSLKRRVPPADVTPRTAMISTARPIERDERSFWNSLSIEVKEPDFDRRRSGAVSIRQGRRSEVMPKSDVQTYVAEIGARLVPAYLRNLPPDDPGRFPIRFLVAKDADGMAMALPNGVVVVFSGLFETLRNEAQLAAVVAHEVAHVTQKHLWKLSLMAPGARLFGYNRSFENQADRLALAYMIDAGYDPRESPRTWKLMARKLGFGPLRGSHENFAIRRAFMMSELERNYPELDYAGLKTEEADFAHIAARVKAPR